MSDDKNLIERPSFLPPAEANVDFGTSEMNKYAKPPRLKIIQAMTSKPFKPPFADRDAIVVPQMIKIGDPSKPISFTPVYFFVSWACWNPAQMKSTLPATRGFTFDPNDDIAKKAKKFVSEPCPENPEFKVTYCEHLNYFFMIHGVEELIDIPIAASFFRGEYTTGQNLIGLIQTRKAPVYACRFQAVVADHEGKKGNWYGFDFINDGEMWVTEKQYAKYSKLYNDLKEAVEARQVEIDFSDSDIEGGATVDAETADDF